MPPLFMHVVPIYYSLMVRIDALFGLHGFATPKKNGQNILDLPLFSSEKNRFFLPYQSRFTPCQRDLNKKRNQTFVDWCHSNTQIGYAAAVTEHCRKKGRETNHWKLFFSVCVLVHTYHSMTTLIWITCGNTQRNQ